MNGLGEDALPPIVSLKRTWLRFDEALRDIEGRTDEMSIDISYDDLEYDPSIARAAVRRNGSDWCVLLEHADATPVLWAINETRDRRSLKFAVD